MPWDHYPVEGKDEKTKTSGVHLFFDSSIMKIDF